MTEVQAQAADLLKVLNRLIEVLQRETELMRQMDPQAMQTLQHDKIVLTAAYESMLQRFRDNPALLSQQDDGLRERIMQASATARRTVVLPTALSPSSSVHWPASESPGLRSRPR